MRTIEEQRAELAVLLAPTDAARVRLIRKTLIGLDDQPEAREVDDDAGTFEAVVSTWDRDRQGEAFVPGAFQATIERWQLSGRRLPVLWGHDAQHPGSLLGSINPHDLYETTEGLRVKGRLDLESRRGREVHRLMKRGSPLGWSIGYLVAPDGAVRRATGRLIKKVEELLEISVTPIPANPRVRTVGVKDVELPLPDRQRRLTHEELRDRLVREGILERSPELQAVLRSGATACSTSVARRSIKPKTTRPTPAARCSPEDSTASRSPSRPSGADAPTPTAPRLRGLRARCERTPTTGRGRRAVGRSATPSARPARCRECRSGESG